MYFQDLQHFLFKPDNWHHGVDLFAINIARGREHGIGSYGALKSFCKEHSIYRKFYTKKMNDANLFINLKQVQAIRDMYISKADAATYTGIPSTADWFCCSSSGICCCLAFICNFAPMLFLLPCIISHSCYISKSVL